MRRVQERDAAAFRTLFDEFAPRVKTWMLQAGATPVVADNLAQQTMITVWEKSHLYNPTQAAVSTWIFQIARNLHTDTKRSLARQSELVASLAVEEPTEALPDVAVAVIECEEQIAQEIERLPPEQAQVLRAVFWDDDSHVKVQQKTGVPLGTIKSRIRLAVQRLRAVVERWC